MIPNNPILVNVHASEHFVSFRTIGRWRKSPHAFTSSTHDEKVFDDGPDTHIHAGVTFVPCRDTW